MTSCLSKLLPYLTSLGISPRKALSQNFLIDPNIVEKVVEAAQIEPGDRVLEIGPGPGALTEVLLARGAQVIAVEYDPALARGLSRLQTDDRRLEIYLDDILRFPLEEKLPKEKVKPLIAPYRLEGIDSERPSGGHPSSPRFKNLGKEGCAPSD
ncbi:MAG: rRNA adenine dimethyltransferase family protein, partial [Candidatus Obscuribacterales bacterium]